MPTRKPHDLIAFLRARYDDEERDALDTEEWHPSPWRYAPAAMKRDAIVDPGDRPVFTFAHGHNPTSPAVRHVERYTPRRILDDLAAMRAILDMHGPDSRSVDQGVPATCRTCREDALADDLEPSPRPYPCPTLRALALPHAEHRDYRPEWTL